MLISSHNVNVTTSNESYLHKYHPLNIKPFALLVIKMAWLPSTNIYDNQIVQQNKTSVAPNPPKFL